MTPDTELGEKPVPANGSEKNPEPAVVPAAPAGEWPRLRTLLHSVGVFGRVEARGITPIPVKERTVTRTINIFTLWWSMSTNILA
jgi:hypothetical protein